MTETEEQAVTIRGEPAILVISEGTKGNDQLYRSASAAVPGQGGQALWNAGRLGACINVGAAAWTRACDA